MKKIIQILIGYFMQWPWPARFLVELAVYVAGIALLVCLINKLGNVVSLKTQFGKIYVVIGTTIAATVGRNRSWGKDLDDKVKSNGQKYENAPMDFHLLSHKIVWVIIGICYVFSVMPDTPLFGYFDGKVAECFLNTKSFFVQKENKWAGDFQLYAPVNTPKVVSNNSASDKKKEILIKLNKKEGKRGISIYQKPMKKAKVVLKFKGKGKIIYMNKTKKGDKGYWVKVNVPSKKISGWIKHSCIQKSVWKKIQSS